MLNKMKMSDKIIINGVERKVKKIYFGNTEVYDTDKNDPLPIKISGTTEEILNFINKK